MSTPTPAFKYFHPIMIFSTLLFLNRKKPSKNKNITYLIYYAKSSAAILIVSYNIYSIYANLAQPDIYTFSSINETFYVFICMFLMFTFFALIFVSYITSARNYKIATEMIETISMTDQHIEIIGNHLNKHLKSVNFIKQYSSLDCPVIITWFSLCYSGAKLADCMWLSDDSLNSVAFGVFFSGMVFFIYNVTIVYLFQRVLVKKFKLLNYVLLQLIKNDIQSVDQIEIIKNVKIVWNLCTGMFKNLISSFGINILMICMLSYEGMIANMFYILHGEWSSFLYGFISFTGISSLIWMQEAINIEVKIN